MTLYVFFKKKTDTLEPHSRLRLKVSFCNNHTVRLRVQAHVCPWSALGSVVCLCTSSCFPDVLRYRRWYKTPDVDERTVSKERKKTFWETRKKFLGQKRVEKIIVRILTCCSVEIRAESVLPHKQWTFMARASWGHVPSQKASATKEFVHIKNIFDGGRKKKMVRSGKKFCNNLRSKSARLKSTSECLGTKTPLRCLLYIPLHEVHLPKSRLTSCTVL